MYVLCLQAYISCLPACPATIERLEFYVTLRNLHATYAFQQISAFCILALPLVSYQQFTGTNTGTTNFIENGKVTIRGSRWLCTFIAISFAVDNTT